MMMLCFFFSWASFGGLFLALPRKLGLVGGHHRARECFGPRVDGFRVSCPGFLGAQTPCKGPTDVAEDPEVLVWAQRGPRSFAKAFNATFRGRRRKTLAG